MDRKTSLTELAKALNLAPSFLFYILKGERRPSSARALILEGISGVGRMTWLYGTPAELRRGLERVYGKINTKRGRPTKEVK